MQGLTLHGGAGYDLEDVKAFLGEERFARLQEFLSTRSVFVCGHARDAKGFEKPCVYQADLEHFLTREEACQ